MCVGGITERGLFYNFWSISRYNLNWDFMFLENKSKLCKCRANQIFWRIRLRQPVWSYTPITIIRMISWAGMSVHKIFIFLLPFFFTIAFCHFLTPRSILYGVFPSFIHWCSGILWFSWKKNGSLLANLSEVIFI